MSASLILLRLIFSTIIINIIIIISTDYTVLYCKTKLKTKRSSIL
jgi:hypothetical protein